MHKHGPERCKCSSTFRVCWVNEYLFPWHQNSRAYAVSLWRFPDSSAWLTRAEQKHSLALTGGSTAKSPLHPRAMLVGKGWMMLPAPRRALGCGPPAAPSRHCQLCSRAAVGQEGEGAVAAPEISCLRWRPCGVSAVS